jgi:Ca2+-binding RTX toxin-like protein
VLRRLVGPALIALVAAGTVGGASAGHAARPAGARVAAPAAAHGAAGDHESSGHGPGYGPGPARHAGPPYKFTTELMGEYSNVVIKDQAMLTRTEHGYRLWSGGQDSHLTVTLVDGGLKFRDTGTKSFKKLSPQCRRQKVLAGISAVCRLPADITTRHPFLVEIWPRLGDDYTDASTLPATFSVTVLSDEGDDVAYLGAGSDFFNGHSTRDKVWGGAGNDWIRAGLGNDLAYGGPGNDAIVGMQGNDDIYGGPGNDRIGGNVGSDRLWADSGADWILCGGGRDRVENDAADRVFPSCETVKGR